MSKRGCRSNNEGGSANPGPWWRRIQDEFYLLGMEKLEQINLADVEEAIRLLNRAVEIDPGLARA